MTSKITDTTISPSDDENSSIITVRSNASNNDSMVRLHLATEHAENIGDAQNSGGGGSMVGSFLTAVQHHQPSNFIDGNEGMQTIVEVVNPLISGQGYANTIAVGRSSDGTYPSFDVNDDGNVAETNQDSLDLYNTASELSLSDRMKNVLQELVKNERVRLSFSQSISEGDDSDSEQNDTDDDANEPLQNDSSDDDESAIPISSSIRLPATEENGNASAAAAIAVDVADAVIAQLNIVDSELDDRAGNNDDIKNANIIDDDFIYTNPNFLMASDEIDASSSQPSTVTTRNERDEKLKEKLLAELNVQPSNSNESKFEKIVTIAESTNEPDEEESSISIHEESTSAPLSPTETSSKSDSISSTGSGKRKKRKSKARRK